MKRKLKWLAIVLAVSLLGFGTALFLWPRDRITAQSWQKIQIGMTEDEVAEILGGPGLNWRDGGEALKKQASEFRNDKGVYIEQEYFFSVLGEYDKMWIGRRGYITIYFEPEGQVITKMFQGWRSAEPSFLDRLRDWLGL
jgi:hypothetical protein